MRLRGVEWWRNGTAQLLIRHRLDELVKPLTLFKLVIGGCRPRTSKTATTHFRPAVRRGWANAHQNSVIPQCGPLRSPFRCVTLRSTSISNRCSSLRGNGIRRIFNGRAACEMRFSGMEVDLVEFACLVFANHQDSKISQNRASGSDAGPLARNRWCR